MDLREYIDVLRRRWRFVVACVLLGLGAGGARGGPAARPPTGGLF